MHTYFMEHNNFNNVFMKNGINDNFIEFCGNLDYFKRGWNQFQTDWKYIQIKKTLKTILGEFKI